MPIESNGTHYPTHWKPHFEALHAFDAEHNVEPCRAIAVRIAGEHGAHWTHPIVDDIARAIEDARELGEKRALAVPPQERVEGSK